jgi:hypothetical protein
MATDVFFPIVDGDQLETAVNDTLQAWFLTYTREFELQRGIPEDSIPQPRSWVIAEDVQREGTDQLPSIVIVSPGLNGDAPYADGEGLYRATWIVGVGIFASANNRDDTKRLVRQYAAIIRAIMLQKQALMGEIPINMVRWMDESYDDNFQFTDEQTISAGQVVFDIEVDDVISRYQGPVGDPDPVTQPGMNWQEIHTTEILVEREV